MPHQIQSLFQLLIQLPSAVLTDDNGLISQKAFPVRTRQNKKQTLKALSMAIVNYKHLLQDKAFPLEKWAPFPHLQWNHSESGIWKESVLCLAIIRIKWWGLGSELLDLSPQTDIYIAILFLLLKAKTYKSILSRPARNRERVIIFFPFHSLFFPASALHQHSFWIMRKEWY